MEWVMLIYLYAGVFAKGDSVAVTTIPGYRTQIECEEAARDLPKLVKGTAKEVVFVCIHRPK